MRNTKKQVVTQSLMKMKSPYIKTLTINNKKALWGKIWHYHTIVGTEVQYVWSVQKRQLERLEWRIGGKILGPMKKEDTWKRRKNDDVHNRVGNMMTPSGKDDILFSATYSAWMTTGWQKDPDTMLGAQGQALDGINKWQIWNWLYNRRRCIRSNRL